MKITGRNGETITTVDDWCEHGGPASPKHWKPGRSAYELAADWIERDAHSKVVELITLLDDVEDLKLLNGVAEKKTSFDGHSGPRNHDLLIRAVDATGPITIGVEGKADEPFDLPLWRYREEALKRAPTTNALARIDHLVNLWFSTSLKRDRTIPPLITIGYQLFSALAGTLADAKTDSSLLAVVLIQEFRTELTDDNEHAHNARVLEDFLLRLLGPDQDRRSNADNSGWVTAPHPLPGDGAKMPDKLQVSFGKLTRDLRLSHR